MCHHRGLGCINKQHAIFRTLAGRDHRKTFAFEMCSNQPKLLTSQPCSTAIGHHLAIKKPGSSSKGYRTSLTNSVYPWLGVERALPSHLLAQVHRLTGTWADTSRWPPTQSVDKMSASVHQTTRYCQIKSFEHSGLDRLLAKQPGPMQAKRLFRPMPMYVRPLR